MTNKAPSTKNQAPGTKNQEPSTKHEGNKHHRVRHSLIVSCLLLAFAGGLGWYYEFERTTFEKLAQQLMAPVGAIWVLLVAATYAAWSWSRQIDAVVISGILLLYTLAGSDTVGEAVIGTLERDYPPVQIAELPEVEYLVILGGGATTQANGVHQLVEAGDRVAMAARCYHAGICRWLLATGSELNIARAARKAGAVHPNREPDPSGATAMLLAELGCDPQRILPLAGRNTSEEIASLAEFLKTRPGATVGIVTSAWHMRRAARLAVQHDLAFVPIPCHHESFGSGFTLFPIPTYKGFRKNEWAVKEYLAAWLGR